MSGSALSFLTPLAELLTMSLMHFVWQGTVLALLLLVVVRLCDVRSARHRYLLSVGTLLLMGIAPVFTAIWYPPHHSQQEVLAAGVPSPANLEMTGDRNAVSDIAIAVAAGSKRTVLVSKIGFEVYVLIAWLLGVCVLSLRLAIGFGISLWIRAKVQPLSAEFEQRVRVLGDRLAVDVQRRVFACARVGQAVAIGFLRPIVLIPATWLTQLSPQALEAIIAHELAHIRRWDLWVNLVQRIIETLLFYHPAVWWLSERIRQEREMCCDEIAADLFDRATYARSLESVAKISNHDLLLAMSISGGRNMKLLNRIGYLLGVTPARTIGNWWTFGLIAIVLPFAALIAFEYSAAAKPPTRGDKKGAGSKAVDAIVIDKIQPKTVTRIEQYVGKIHSHRHIQIRSLERGYLDEIFVKEGESVKVGDLIFKIHPVTYQAKLDEVSAETQIAQLEFNNTKRLHESKVVSNDELAIQQAKLAKAKAKQNLAAAELQFAEVKAPFDGVIDRFQCQTGSVVMEGEHVTTLSDNSIVWVYFNVPEQRYLDYMVDNRLREDLQVELTLANGVKFDQPGRVAAVEAAFNSETGNIAFRADFPNPKGTLRHGQRGTITLSRPVKNAIVVPRQATFEVLDKLFVYSVDQDQIAHLREITVQDELNDSYVVNTGLKGGDQIVVEGLRQIVEGGKVTGGIDQQK